MSAPLRVTVLCGPSPRHVYFANRLCAAAEVPLIVQQAGRDLSAARLARLARPGNALPKLSRWLRDRRRYSGGGEARFFFGDQTPAFTHPERVCSTVVINDPEVDRRVRASDPDLVAVFGTSLIRAPLLGAGRLGMVNLHGGLSPWYRGADATFWALYNGEPERIGCTIHYINEGIDTGALIAHVAPEVHPRDDELTLFWRAVRDATEAFAELVQRLATGERFGQPQPPGGRLYRVRDRGWRHERTLARRLRGQPLVPRSLPRRITWFHTEAVQAAAREEASTPRTSRAAPRACSATGTTPAAEPGPVPSILSRTGSREA